MHPESRLWFMFTSFAISSLWGHVAEDTIDYVASGLWFLMGVIHLAIYLAERKDKQ